MPPQAAEGIQIARILKFRHVYAIFWLKIAFLRKLAKRGAKHLSLFVHGGCAPASITQKQPNHGQVSVHGQPKFVKGQQPYVQ